MIRAVPVSRSAFARLGTESRALLALGLVFTLGLIFNADGAFFQAGTHRDALRQASVNGILACGMTVVILTGGIDLAVGSILAFSAVSFSMFAIWWSWHPFTAIAATIAGGLACGLVSGTLTSRFRIQPFIATLAMMVFARGLAKSISGGVKVSTALPNPDGSYRAVALPKIFSQIDSRFAGDYVSMVTVIFLVCAAVCWILLGRHRFGQYVYAIGGNEEAARLSGVPVRLTKIAAYAISGTMSAIAGICQAAQEQQGDPEAGTGYELTAIAMVVIGGTSLSGGRGGIGLTLLGTIIIGYLEKILSINAVPEANRLMLTGIIIVVAVLTQRRGGSRGA
jgi:ribose transport system permease protein